MVRGALEAQTFLQPDGDFDARIIRIKDCGSADTDYSLSHGLGRIPVGCQVILASASCNVYKGTRWTAQVADLKFTAANADVTIRIW